MTEPVFVFGSNLAGHHGKGAALFALKHRGAIYGQGKAGPQGNSYAIPTKDKYLRVIPLDDIAFDAAEFVRYATEHPELQFQLTPIGCGLAGYVPEQIAPMFAGSPLNVKLPPEFEAVLRAPAPQPGGK